MRRSIRRQPPSVRRFAEVRFLLAPDRGPSFECPRRPESSRSAPGPSDCLAKSPGFAACGHDSWPCDARARPRCGTRRPSARNARLADRRATAAEASSPELVPTTTPSPLCGLARPCHNRTPARLRAPRHGSCDRGPRTSATRRGWGDANSVKTTGSLLRIANGGLGARKRRGLSGRPWLVICIVLSSACRSEVRRYVRLIVASLAEAASWYVASWWAWEVI